VNRTKWEVVVFLQLTNNFVCLLLGLEFAAFFGEVIIDFDSIEITPINIKHII